MPVYTSILFPTVADQLILVSGSKPVVLKYFIGLVKSRWFNFPGYIAEIRTFLISSYWWKGFLQFKAIFFLVQIFKTKIDKRLLLEARIHSTLYSSFLSRMMLSLRSKLVICWASMFRIFCRWGKIALTLDCYDHRANSFGRNYI